MSIDTLNVPWLRSGAGETPADGGCILQVVDWIDRNEWTDRPPCVHPVLAKLAVSANDRLDDKGRQRLLGLVPRLMGTASDDKVLSVRLVVFCARRMLHLFEEKRPGDDRPRKAIEVAEAWCDDLSDENRASAYAAAHAGHAVHGVPYAAHSAAYAAYSAAYAAAHGAAHAVNAAGHAANAAAHAVNAANAANGAAVEDLLLAVLDEYDRLTGRTRSCTVDLAPVARMLAGERA